MNEEAGAQSSFATFSSNIMVRTKSVKEDEISSSGSSSFCACFIDKGVDAYSNKDSAEFCDPVGNEVERSFVRPKELSDNFTDSTIRTAVDTFCDIAHATSVCVQDVDQPQVGASKNALFNNREVSRRKRMRPTSPQEDPCKENAEDTCKPEEVCAIEVIFRNF